MDALTRVQVTKMTVETVSGQALLQNLNCPPKIVVVSDVRPYVLLSQNGLLSD